MTRRNTAAAPGFANNVRSECSSNSPSNPTGMVATTISQPSRCVEVSTFRVRTEVISPPMMPTQSRQ
ncbi:Uncharacterised protein [Mycobacteroides abscessus subsp. abscessus]|nr:Uncharacterised protein [Mycobacteroides abscessus subsp. abscessus]